MNKSEFVPKVSVAILNWNGLKWLQQCLPGVVMHSSNAEVWVVDNGSVDGSVDWVRSNFSGVSVLELGENYGYAGGYNRAINHIQTEWVICLNSDVEVTEGWIDAMVRSMELHPGCGAFQPKILDMKRRTHFEYAGAGGGLIDFLGYPFCRGRWFHFCEEDRGQYGADEIFWASGAALVLNKSAWLEAGKFDETFFAHMEEIDLCWRIKNKGYTIRYCPDSVVYHFGGGTLEEGSSRKIFLNFRNNLSMLLKNKPANSVWYVIPLRMILDGFAAIKMLFEPNGINKFFSVFKAHIAFYLRMPFILRERFRIKPRKLSPIYSGSIVWDFFVLNKNRPVN